MADEKTEGQQSSAETTPGVPGATPGDWKDVCPLAELKPNSGKYVEVSQHQLAVFKLDEDKVHVINDVCPHAGGSLASGWVQNGVVYCPWHAWPFQVSNGQCPDNPGIKVRAYECRVNEGKVQVKL